MGRRSALSWGTPLNKFVRKLCKPSLPPVRTAPFPTIQRSWKLTCFLSMAVRTSAPRPRAGLSQSTILLLPLQSGKAMFTANIPPFWESSIPRYWRNTSPGDFNNRTQEAAWGTFHHAAFSIVSNRQNRIGFSCVLSVPACFLKWRTILSM